MSMIALLLAGMQIGPKTYDAFETLMLQSERFVIGHVARTEQEITVPRDGARDGTTWPDGWAEWTIEVVVRETFKGPDEKRFTFVQETSATNQYFADLMKQNTRCLWIKAPKGGWHGIEIDKRIESIYKTDGLPMFSMDFTVLRTADQAIAAARRFKSEVKGQTPETVKFDIPFVFAAQVSAPGDGACFVIPLMQSSRKTAQSLIDDPFRFLPPRKAYESNDGWLGEGQSIASIGKTWLQYLNEKRTSVRSPPPALRTLR
jgi:hypothetical protein